MNDKKCLERCGEAFENHSCSNKDDCCSADGYCGTANEFCYSSQGCQDQFGVCKCGVDNENGRCTTKCCSASGFCGTANAFCSIANGCQKPYGVCTENSSGVTCTEVKTHLGMENDGSDKFRCEENEDGFAETL